MAAQNLFDMQFVQWSALAVSSTLALIFMLIKVPKTEYAKNLTKSKNTIAVSYLICAFLFGYTLYNSDITRYNEFSALTMLIVTAFSSIIISYSLINLVQPRYMDSSKFMLSVFLVFLGSMILVESFFSESKWLHNLTLYIGIGLFVFQSVYLIIIFDRAYKKSLYMLEKYYDEDEEHKVKWIRFCYILTMLTDMFILVYMVLPHKMIKLYTFFYILYLIYFAGNFISFLGSHKLLLDAVGHYELTEQNSRRRNNKMRRRRKVAFGQDLGEDDYFYELKQSLDKWVEQKRYREYDKSREDIAKELNTSKEFLQMYFTDRLGVDFRSWRTELRINDAKALLIEKKDCSINIIGETVGFSDRSNFHRQFTRLVGCSPKEWRDSEGHPENLTL